MGVPLLGSLEFPLIISAKGGMLGLDMWLDTTPVGFQTWICKKKPYIGKKIHFPNGYSC